MIRFEQKTWLDFWSFNLFTSPYLDSALSLAFTLNIFVVTVSNVGAEGIINFGQHAIFTDECSSTERIYMLAT